MVEQAPYFRSYDPDIDPYSEDNSDPRRAPYPFERSTRNDFQPDPAPLFLSDYDGEPDPSEFAPSLRSNRKATCLVPNPGGRSGSLGRSTAGHAVFIGCHTRTDRQRQSLDQRRSARSICIGAAGFRTTDCPRHAVEGSGAGTGARPSIGGWCANSGNDGRHGADARGNHDGVSIRAAEPCAGRRRIGCRCASRLRASGRCAAVAAPAAAAPGSRPLLRQGRSTPTNSPHS